MKSAELNNPIVRFQGGGDYGVRKVRYEGKGKQVYINDSQYFEGMEERSGSTKLAVTKFLINGLRIGKNYLLMI